MVTRRALVASLLLMAALAASTRGEVGRAQTVLPPNFLVIVTDDQRAETVEAMPQTMSRFADLGTRFTNAFATTPLCCPSRASIFTGRYAHNHRIKTNRKSTHLNQDTTVQRYLRELGYSTAIFGKYLNEWKDDPPHFDRWAVPRSRGYYGGIWNLDGARTNVSTYSTTFLTQEAIDFISETEDIDVRPWLMFVTPQAAHRPYNAEPKYSEVPVPEWQPPPSINEEDVSDKPRYISKRPPIELAEAEAVRAKQLRTLYSVDDMVESLYAALEERDELDNTYVFYLSDNGHSWGDHRLLNGGSLKNTPYTSSVEIPLLMSGPSLEPGSVDERLVANIDIAPTMVELSGLPVDDDPPMDGRSLVSDHNREWLLLEWWRARERGGIPPWRSLRSQSAQYTEYIRKRNIVAREYYDLLDDPYELENLLDGSDDPDVSTQHELLMGYYSCSGSTCP